MAEAAPHTTAPKPPGFDKALVRAHVELIHNLAAGVDGLVIVAAFHEDPGETPDKARKDKPVVMQFAVGQVDATVKAIMACEGRSHVNVYMPFAVMRRSLDRNKKGFEKDMVASLAAVADMDNDKDQGGELPLEPPYLIESSFGNFQAVYPWAKPLPVSEAKPLAEALAEAVGCDQRTKDTSGVWRVPGTLNWPTAKKVHERGRSRDPQPVRVRKAFTGELVDVETMRETLAPQLEAAASAAAGRTARAEASGDGEADVAALMKAFPAGLRKLIKAPPLPDEDRSSTVGSVVAQMVRRGLSDAQIIAVIEAHSAGVGARYAGRSDLSADVARIRRKTEDWDRKRKEDTGPRPGDDDVVARIARTYPLPWIETQPLEYATSAAGRVMVNKLIQSKKKGEPPIQSPIATPFGVVARLRFVDQADAYGLRIVVEDMNGQPRALDVDRAGFSRQGAADARALLFAAGLRVQDDGESIVIQCLKAADPKREILIFAQPGWHRIGDSDAAVFVCPDGTIAGAIEAQAYELAASARMTPRVARHGTLEGWRKAVETALSIDGAEHWTLGVVAGFVGPIVSLTGLDTCGVSFDGMSSGGKTLAQRLAASAWSRPAGLERDSLFQTAKATVNAAEGMAARANGTVLVLDELAHVSGKELAKMIYTFAGGVGKARMTAEAMLRASYTWATFVLLSSESTLEEKVRADEGDWLAGMAVRFVDIDVSDVNRNVGRADIDRIASVDQHYGHAGPAFVSAMVAASLDRDAVNLRESVLKVAARIAGAGADSARSRAAIPFALMQVAGELAVRFGLLPDWTNVAGSVLWGWARFARSSSAMVLDPKAQVIANLRTWVLRRWNSTIRSVTDTGLATIKAEGWYDEGAVYVLREHFREAIGNTMTEEAAAKILVDEDLIAKREQDRPFTRYVRGVGKVQCYAVKRPEFGRQADGSGTSFKVYPGGREASGDGP